MQMIKGRARGVAPAVDDEPAFVRGLAEANPVALAGPNIAPVFQIFLPITRVSTDGAGGQADESSFNPSFSPGGGFVLFDSFATNLIAGDTNGRSDVFLKNITTGAVTRISIGAAGEEGNHDSTDARFSADGTKIVFESLASNFAAGDAALTTDIFVKNLVSGQLTLVSSNAAGASGNGNSSDAVFSPDANKVAFVSTSSNLVAGDANGLRDLFVKDLTTGAVTLVAQISTATIGSVGTASPVFSPDGTKLLFQSAADNLVAGDGNGRSDIFLKDLVSGTITRISTSGAGVGGNDLSSDARFSPDGTKILFHSEADNLVAGDTNSTSDIFIKDLATGAVTLVSTNADGIQGNAGSTKANFSPDGNRIVFHSFADNLVPADTNSTTDVFVKDLITGAVTRHSTSWGGLQGNDQSLYPAFSPDGASIVFQSEATTLVDNDTNGDFDIFVSELSSKFTENGGAVTVFRNILLSDADSDTYAGGTLTAQISPGAGGGAGDTLFLTLDQGIGVSGDQVFVNGNIVFGTISGGGASFSVALHDNAADWMVEALIEALRWINTSDDPGAFRRTVTVTLRDGGGTTGGGDDTASLSRDIVVTPVNDAPVLAASSGIVAHFEGTAVRVDPGFTISDVDASRITNATISCTVGATGDWLNFVNDNAALYGDIYITQQTVGALLLASNGGATRAQWQNALRAITYTTLDDFPIEGNRTVTFILRDSDEADHGILSNFASRQLIVTGVNDVPTNILPAAQAMDENGVLTFSAANGNAITIADPDTTGSSLMVTLTVADGALALTSGYVVVTGQGTSSLTVTGSVDQVNNALDGLIYTPPANANGGRTIRVATGDGGGQGTVYLIVNPGAEAGSGASNLTNVVTPQGWTALSGGMTALRYFTSGTDLTPNSPAQGEDFFAGGPNGDSSLRQLIDVSGRAAEIDSGLIQANLFGLFGGRGGEGDNMVLTARFLAAGGALLGSAELGGLLQVSGSFLLPRDVHPMVPAGTRTIELLLIADHVDGAYNDAYADDLQLTLDRIDVDTLGVTIIADPHDIVPGTPGADAMAAGPGNDIYYVNHAGDTVFEAAGEGSDQIFASLSHMLSPGSEVELLTTIDDLATTAINLTGNALSQSLYGNAGSNRLDGGGGGDVMVGFQGDDFYIVRHVSDRAVEAAGGGFDRVLAAASFTLEAGSHVEMFTTIDNLATNAINLTGNTLSQYLYGNAGSNRLDGGGGGDVMVGFQGDDFYVVRHVSDRAVEAAGQGFDRVLAAASFTLEAGSHVEMFTTIDNLATTAINLTGNTLSQYLYGNAGSNRLDGGGGGDVMVGFQGDDFYVVRHVSDRAVEAAGQGFDRVLAGASFTLEAGSHVEMFTTIDNLATTAINLTGNALSQYLYGNAGSNRLDGGGGGDVMVGFQGDDFYVVRHVSDRAVEAAGQGFDRVLAAASFTLEAGSAVEMFTTIDNLATTAINLTGNALAQYLYGNAGANRLDGGGGGDVMVGFGGDDVYHVRNAADRAVESGGGGSDRVRAAVSFTLEAGSEIETLATIDDLSTAAINLTGNGFAQSVIGNAGSNHLNGGGGGADLLQGLGGNDTYIVDNDDIVFEAAGGGFDTVTVSNYHLLAAGAEVEVLSTTDQNGTAGITLWGNELSQTVIGNAGANQLNGGGGADTLQGLGGQDVFVFYTALGGGNVDTILDFVSVDDHFFLNHTIFTGLPIGPVDGTRFAFGSAAADADDRIIYNLATGQLFFDADGNGAGEQVLFAILSGAPTLSSADFQVI